MFIYCFSSDLTITNNSKRFTSLNFSGTLTEQPSNRPTNYTTPRQPTIYLEYIASNFNNLTDSGKTEGFYSVYVAHFNTLNRIAAVILILYQKSKLC